MAASADAGDAAHNFVVKRTFIDVVEAAPSPPGCAGMRRRCCSDPTLFETAAAQAGTGACFGEEGEVEFDLCGFSDTETLDGNQDSELPCYGRMPGAAPLAPLPLGACARGAGGLSDTETLDGNRDSELPCNSRMRGAASPAPLPSGAPGPARAAGASADAAASPAAPPERAAGRRQREEASARQLASENARLQAENRLLRERCAVVEEAWGTVPPPLQQQMQWGGAMVQMPVGFVSLPICVAQLPVDDAWLGARGGGSPARGARQSPPQKQQQQQQQGQGQRGGRTAQKTSRPTPPERQEVSPTRTTVMLRNLPNNYTRAMLLSMLDNEGFAKQYDFVYLPIDFKTRACLGYAFINLVDADIVPRFWRRFDGYSSWIMPSRKLCHISWSEPHQGLEMHLDRYRNSPIMHATVPDEHKPVVFEEGVRVPFPEPTKATRAPRPRPSMAPKEHPARQARHCAGGPARAAGAAPGGRGAGSRASAVRGGQR